MQTQPVSLDWRNSLANPIATENRQNYPGKWEKVLTDLYLKAQGLITKDHHSITGHGWYNTTFRLEAKILNGNDLHVRFPGLFNKAWLYLNGKLIAHREQRPMW